MLKYGAQRFFSNCIRSYSLSSLLKSEQKKNLTPILKHPFNVLMCKGALAPDVFIDFLQADAIYLAHYGKLLQRLAHRKEFYGKPEGQDLTNIAFGIVSSERKMQRRYLAATDKYRKKGAPHNTVLQYLNHMEDSLMQARNPVIPLAAMLPCFWVYKHIGIQYQVRNVSSDHRYFYWLNTYASNNFLKAEARMWEILDAQPFESDDLDLLRLVFKKSLQYEGAFFDSVLPATKQNLAFPVINA